MTYHTFLFSFITILNVICYILIHRKFYYERSISTFFHLYFCILASFVYKDMDLVYCSAIYFIIDSFLNIYFKCFKIFNKFHHLFMLFLLYNHEKLDKTIMNYSGIHEFSTIILCLIDMKFISKNTFEKIFPISFIMCRIVVFNILIFIYLREISYQIDNFNCIILGILNIMNIAITIKMRLLQKTYYFLNNLYL